jgi:hypothetical protein
MHAHLVGLRRLAPVLLLLLNLVVSTGLQTDAFWSHLRRWILHVPLASHRTMIIDIIPLALINGRIPRYVYPFAPNVFWRGASLAPLVPDRLRISIWETNASTHTSSILVALTFSQSVVAVLPLIPPIMWLVLKGIQRWGSRDS